MSKSQLLATGMFRSGTTLLARMLDSHPSICLASDPFAPLFKCFRDEIAYNLMGESFDFNSPLNDYYFDQFQQNLFQAIQDQNFNLPLKYHNINDIKKKISEHCRPYSPQIIDHLDNLKGTTYKDIIKNGFDIIRKSYGKRYEKIVGIKEVWTTEFSPHFLKTFDSAKIIIIIRDPRAVIASNYATQTHRYPFLFLSRQWRKLTLLGQYYSDSFPNVLLLKFEDLINEPEVFTKNICKFLGVSFHDNLITPSRFKDGSNNEWIQNSTYKEVKMGFNKGVINKWSKVLTESQLKFIEALCYFEMLKMDYKMNFVFSVDDAIKTLKTFDDLKNGIARWIKPYISLKIDDEKLLEINRLKNYGSTNRKTNIIY